MLYRILLYCSLFLQVSALADSRPDIFDMGELYFQTVGDEESIPLGIITALTQDGQGFLWIGTQKGLVRYDGYRFRRFQFNNNDPQSLGGGPHHLLGEEEHGSDAWDRYIHSPQKPPVSV